MVSNGRCGHVGALAVNKSAEADGSAAGSAGK